MTTDSYGDAGSTGLGGAGAAPVAPDYGISDPFTPVTTAGSGSDDRPAGATAAGASDGTADTAKAEAGQVRDTAVDAAQQVAGTAKEEAGNVVGEAKAQASNLLEQVKGEAGSQAGTQQQRLAGMVGAYAKELGSMASGSKDSGPLTDLAHQASERAGAASHWLENHEPAELLDEVRRFARRRPGTFLLGAVVAGVVVGRLTRGAVDEARSDDAPAGAGAVSTPELPTTYPTGPGGYAEPAAGYGSESVAGFGTEPVVDPYAAQSATVYGTPASGAAPGDVAR